MARGYCRTLQLHGAGRNKSSMPEPSPPSPPCASQDALGWGSVHVVGFSMGGMIATKLASARPHRVRSLLLLRCLGAMFGRYRREAQLWVGPRLPADEHAYRIMEYAKFSHLSFCCCFAASLPAAGRLCQPRSR